MVKRTVTGGLAALAYLIIMPVLALAQTQEGSSLGQPEGPTVGGTGGILGRGGEAGAGAAAFTGAELAGLVLLAIVLAGAGIAALVTARRRSTGSRAVQV